mgnify:CR=1 FL=1
MQKALLVLLALGLALLLAFQFRGNSEDGLETERPADSSGHPTLAKGTEASGARGTDPARAAQPASARETVPLPVAPDSATQGELRFLVISKDTGLPIERAWVRSGKWKSTTDELGVALRPFSGRDELARRWAEIGCKGHVTKKVRISPDDVEITTKLTAGIEFEVRVVNGTSGLPMEGVQVRAQHLGDEDEEFNYRAEATTTETGLASLPTAYSGREVQLYLSRDGYPSEDSTLLVDRRGPHRIDFGAGGVLNVRFVSFDGGPLDGALLDLVSPYGTIWGRQAFFRTDAQGQARLSGVDLDMQYYLRCEKPVARSQVFEFTSAETEKWVELVAEPAGTQLNVRVTDEVGKPWHAVELFVGPRPSGGQAPWLGISGDENSRSDSTDEAGRASIPLAFSGPMRLQVSHGDRVVGREDFDVVPGETHSLELTYARGRSLFGRFLDEAGGPLGKHRVTYKGLSTTTDSSGDFAIHGVDQEPGVLVLTKKVDQDREGLVRLTAMRFPNTEPNDKRMEFRRTKPVLLKAICPPGSAVVESRWAVTFFEDTRMTHNRVLAKNGTATLLVASNAIPWSVSVREDHAQGTPRVFANLSPAPGTEVDLGDLSQPSGRTIQGTARDSIGVPLPAIPVQVAVWPEGWYRDVITDVHGVYKLENVPEGQGSVHCSLVRNGEVIARADKRFDASPDSETLDLDLVEHRTVSGVVRRKNGTPAQHVLIMFTVVLEDGRRGVGHGDWSTGGGAFGLRLKPGPYQVSMRPFGTDFALEGPRIEMPGTEDLGLLLEVP